MLALALSGGGYRASLFHLGVMARLADEGLLRHVSVISTVSGGSIIGAYYYGKLCGELKKDTLLTDSDYRRLIEELIPEFLAFVQDDVRDRVLYSGLISRIVPEQIIKGWIRLGVGSKRFPNLKLERALGSQLEQVMGNLLFESAVWSELTAAPANARNKKPELVLNTSVLENGRQLFFTSNPESLLWKENERNHGICAQDVSPLPVSRLVAASACVPGLFNPIPIAYGDRSLRVHGVDGGVLDNLGGNAIQLLGQEGMKPLVSDASKPLSVEHYSEVNSVQSFFRIQDIFMDTIRELRLKGTDEAVVQIREDIAGIDPEVRELVLDMRTDLNSFSEVEAYSLMVAGYFACGRETDKLRSQPGIVAEPVGPADDWVFMQIRPYMEKPTPEYLSLLGQKKKPKRSLPSVSPFQLLSLGYLLLYVTLFVYIWIERSFMKALLYVGLIPVIGVSLVGLVMLRRTIVRGRKKGTMSALTGITS